MDNTRGADTGRGLRWVRIPGVDHVHAASSTSVRAGSAGDRRFSDVQRRHWKSSWNSVKRVYGTRILYQSFLPEETIQPELSQG